MFNKKAFFIYLGIAFLLVLIDFASKQFAILKLSDESYVPIINNLFGLTLVYNKGAAFSFLADLGGIQQYFFIGITLITAVMLVYWLIKMPDNKKLEAFAFAFILGGAIGNLIDRIYQQKVTDFLLLHWGTDWYFPVFNLADVFINIGVALFLLNMFVERKNT